MGIETQSLHNMLAARQWYCVHCLRAVDVAQIDMLGELYEPVTDCAVAIRADVTPTEAARADRVAGLI